MTSLEEAFGEEDQHLRLSELYSNKLIIQNMNLPKDEKNISLDKLVKLRDENSKIFYEIGQKKLANQIEKASKYDIINENMRI